jgi:hypothetical protein
VAPTTNGTTTNGTGPHETFASSPAIAAMKGDELSRAEEKALLAQEQGTPFDPFERMFASFDAGLVFNYGEFAAADYRNALGRSGKMRALEQVLTLPLRSAERTITAADGDNGECALVEEVLGPKLSAVVDQMTSAITYKRAFFETSWTTDAKGRVVYDDIAHRPATGCEAGFDPATGRYKGFRQRVVPVAGYWPNAKGPGVQKSSMPGYVIIKPNRAFIYVHGVYRDPINGLSDLDVALWCYETLQKVMFLWFQFLEQQALPKTIIYGDDDLQAEKRATQLAGLRASGVLGVARSGGDAQKTIDIIESSGKGAEQYLDAIRYLESSMVNSVLAGFTELPAHTSQSGSGSYALSADQSEFFLASRQAVADEIADSIRRDLFAPMCVYNFGPDAAVPKLEIGPLSKTTSQTALDLLKSVVVAPTLNVPRDFVDQLTLSVASRVGLDPDQVQDAIDKDVIERKERADALAEQMKQAPPPQAGPQPSPPKPGPATPPATPPKPGPKRPTPPAVAAAAAPSAEAVEMAAAADFGYRLISGQLAKATGGVG